MNDDDGGVFHQSRFVTKRGIVTALRACGGAVFHVQMGYFACCTVGIECDRTVTYKYYLSRFGS